MQLKIVNDYDAFIGIQKQWQGLIDPKQGRTLPLTHEWLFSWWSSFANNENLFIICLYEAEKLVSIAPFILEKTNYRFIKVTSAKLMANGHSPFCNVIFSESLNQALQDAQT